MLLTSICAGVTQGARLRNDVPRGLEGCRSISAQPLVPTISARFVRRGNFLVIVSGGKRLDFAAFVLILVLSVLLCWGMKETKTVNNGPLRSSHINQGPHMPGNLSFGGPDDQALGLRDCILLSYVDSCSLTRSVCVPTRAYMTEKASLCSRCRSVAHPRCCASRAGIGSSF